MTEFNINLKDNNVSAKVRARALARVYEYILSLPDPREKVEPAGDFVGEAIAGSSKKHNT